MKNDNEYLKDVIKQIYKQNKLLVNEMKMMRGEFRGQVWFTIIIFILLLIIIFS